LLTPSGKKPRMAQRILGKCGGASASSCACGLSP
jgi:hypothetical protein